MATSPEILELQRRKAELKALLDAELAGKTESERLTIKEGTAYKNNLKLLKEMNEQILEIKSNNKITIDSLIEQESKLKGLSGIEASLVELNKKRLISQQELEPAIQESINSIASMNQELLSMSAEDNIARKLQGEQI
jgi:hypothetical protein